MAHPEHFPADKGVDAPNVGERAMRVATAAHDIGGFIRSLREEAQVSLRQLARMAGVSNPYLSQIERGLRNPSAEVLTQIARGLRVSSEALYMRAGLLEQRAPSPVREALLSDPDIDERQKQVLLDIYESFRHQHASELAARNSVEWSGDMTAKPGNSAHIDGSAVD